MGLRNILVMLLEFRQDLLCDVFKRLEHSGAGHRYPFEIRYIPWVYELVHVVDRSHSRISSPPPVCHALLLSVEGWQAIYG